MPATSLADSVLDTSFRASFLKRFLALNTSSDVMSVRSERRVRGGTA